MLDATYKTTRYALPLFFLCVKTNVNYQVVATFVILNESRQQISEALEMIKAWNPNIWPSYGMTDYVNAEIGAMQDTWEGIQHLDNLANN